MSHRSIVASELLMVRHGESEANVGLSTDPDCPLTSRGREQARVLGASLARFDLGDFIGLTSPYRRARDTAADLEVATGVRFEIDPDLREWGATAVVDGQNYPSEPIEKTVKRLRTFLRRWEGRRLLVVAHAAPIALLTQLAWGEIPTTEGKFWLGVGNCCPRWVKALCAPGNESMLDAPDSRAKC